MSLSSLSFRPLMAAPLLVGIMMVSSTVVAIADPPTSAPASPATSRPTIPDVPEPISSFGAAILGKNVYIYSGHTGEAHAHSRENVSKKFLRINVAKPTEWESLPMERALQGLSIVADDQSIYRIGGLIPHNAPDQPDDLESTAEVAKFDPASKKWTKLPPLPAGRSSHDAFIYDHVLYVVGGWRLSKQAPHWYDRSLKLRLDVADAKWEELPAQPFRRRALAVVAVANKVYAIGGMTEDAKPSTDVHVFDIATQKWSAGPSMPGKGLSGFGCAAAVLASSVYVTTMEGNIYRLDSAGKEWQSAGKLQTPRFFHRLLPVDGDTLLAVGGASRKEHLKSPEWITPPTATRTSSR